MPHAFALAGWGTHATRMRPIVSALSDQGLETRCWDYTPAGSIRGLGARLAQAAAGVGDEVHLVGHSLGGLVAASAVLHHGAEVTSVTTVNAPWHGTWAAWTAHPDDPLGRELRWRSDALAELRDALEDHLEDDAGPRWTVLSAAGDLAVPPTSSLRLPDGERLATRVVPVTGHSVSLVHQRMVDAVTEHVVGVAA